MIRFTAYRRNISSSDRHNEITRNPDDEPQFEGVVFSSGRVVINWLTPAGGLSIFDSLEAALATHGHPEVGTQIVWHDGAMPEEWAQQLIHHAEHQQGELMGNGLAKLDLVEKRDKHGNLTRLTLRTPGGHFTKQIFPVPHE